MKIEDSVSVLIPFAGDSQFLKKALDSVLIQRFPSIWEIVIIKKSPEILIDIKLPKNVKVFDQKATGLVSALNEGLKHCKYNYIARLDSDDLMYPNRITRQINEFNKREKLVALGGQAFLIDEKGDAISPILYPAGKKLTKWSLRFSSCLPHPGTTIRKDALVKVGGYRQGYEHAEDYDLWARLSEVGEIDNLKTPVLFYRRHKLQLSDKNLGSTLKVSAGIMAVLDFKNKNSIKSFSHAEEIMNQYPKIYGNYLNFLEYTRSRNYLNIIKLAFTSKKIFYLLVKKIILKIYFYIVLLVRIRFLGFNKNSI